MGSFFSRALILAFGYVYPGYLCFKVVEKNPPEIEQLLFWCQYWILVALLGVCERVADNVVSWLPLYSVAKLASFIYLWHPKLKGTAHVYNGFLRPFLEKHESEIDRDLLELRDMTWEIALVFWQRAAVFGRAKLFQIMQYVSSHQSASQPHSADKQVLNPEDEEFHASNPISQPSKENLQAKELENLQQNVNSNSLHNEKFGGESIHLRHGRWRLFRSWTNP